MSNYKLPRLFGSIRTVVLLSHVERRFLSPQYSLKFVSLFLCSCVLLFVFGCQPMTPERQQLQGRTMGTTYNIAYYPAQDTPNSSVVQAAIDKRLLEVNQIASTYIDDSELSLLNRHSTADYFPISDDLRVLLAESMRIAELTDGALDVTVGPLVNLWGFGPDKRPNKVPSAQLIADTRARVGIDKLTLEQMGASKAHPELYVDLSTIAKGYGVDEVAAVLASFGIENYLVEIGGELLVKGKKANGQNWRVAIEKPVSQQQAVQKVIEPLNNAVATSGDYRNYYEFDGVRYSHIIEPHSGKPITHKLVLVTVLHPSCMTADGLATGFLVMGLAQGLALANQHGIAALFIEKQADGSFKETYSEAMKPYLP